MPEVILSLVFREQRDQELGMAHGASAEINEAKIKLTKSNVAGELGRANCRRAQPPPILGIR
jgi:hypothetical protein